MPTRVVKFPGGLSLSPLGFSKKSASKSLDIPTALDFARINGFTSGVLSSMRNPLGPMPEPRPYCPETLEAQPRPPAGSLGKFRSNHELFPFRY
jgi:hypothetical protein